VVIYEPAVTEQGVTEFKSISDVNVANRLFDEIADVADKIFTRDLFGKD
jgi:UDPglucose 6-dehydrogenase